VGNVHPREDKSACQGPDIDDQGTAVYAGKIQMTSIVASLSSSDRIHQGQVRTQYEELDVLFVECHVASRKPT